MEIYKNLCNECSQNITKRYSTSFYNSSLLFPKSIREAIFSIYGFVRLADELVDTFHQVDQSLLLDRLENELFTSLQLGISLNPILESFRRTVVQYQIPQKYIRDFLTSMRQDLNKKTYLTKQEMNDYVYGSADVVGLMCLSVFCVGNAQQFNQLEPYARKLGSAFQKINFLRDINYDKVVLNRQYFPYSNEEFLTEQCLKEILNEIDQEFTFAFDGIKQLPKSARLAVYTAYRYYRALNKKIARQNSATLQKKRIRINNMHKFYLFILATVEIKTGKV